MKKIILIASLFISASVFAGDVISQPIGPFGTLNNRDSSYTLSADKAQDLLNVEITAGGKSVKKRKGYAPAFTLDNSTSAMHGIYSFYDSNGNDVSLFFNDTKLSVSVNGGSPSVIFSTGSNGATYQCTDSLGVAYCVNSARSALTKITASTSSSISGVASVGSMVATAVNRLAMSGFSDAPSRIDLSAETDFTNWTPGSLGSSPVQITVNSPGARITHITYAFGRLIWFKDTSFGYILIGNQPLQTDWVVKTVSYDVGTNDNTSVYREGILYFRGKDSHIYAFDGSSYVRISKEISSTIDMSQTRSANSWTLTTQADWGLGQSTPTVTVSSTSVPGSLVLSTEAALSAIDTSQSDFSSANTLTHIDLTSVPGSVLISAGQTSAELISRSFDVGFTTSTFLWNWGSFQIDDVGNGAGATISYQTQTSSSTNGVWESGASIVNNATITSSNNRYIRYVVDLTRVSASDASPRVNSVSFTSSILRKSSATYYSSVKNAPFLTSWDTFQTFDYGNGGTVSYFLRSSTNPISILSSTPTWVSITNGAIPATSTGTYFQTRADFRITNATQSPQIDYITQNWFEGNSVDKSYATYFNDKILWSVTSGAGASTNNSLLIYDLINQGWIIWDIPSNGFLIRQNKLYFGSSSSGVINKYGDTDSDNGSAINSYWKSKDFFGDSPFTDKEYPYLSIISGSVAASSMTVTYTINGSRSSSLIIPIYAPNNSFSKRNKNLPAGLVGNTFNIKFGNNAANQPFEVFGIEYGIRPKPWTTTNP